MGRFLFGVGLMLCLLGIGLACAWSIERAQAPILQVLEQAADTADPVQAAALLDQAWQAWNKNWCGTAALTDHEPMDEIDSLFAQTKAYVQAGQMADFSAFCLRLSALIQASAEGHAPTWWNFL